MRTRGGASAPVRKSVYHAPMQAIPHTTPPGAGRPAPGRFGATIVTEDPGACHVALLGLPDDTGVRLNGGRAGAAAGPAAFRAALHRYGAEAPAGWAWPRVFDAGDVAPAGQSAEALEATHRRITEAASALLELGLVPVGIGGGHDLTFPLVRAAAARFPGLRGLYFDAHLDVRAEPGSGMPFRALLEQTPVEAVELFGFSPMVNSSAHLEWFLAHGGSLGEEIDLDNRFEAPEGADGPAPDLFVSLDLDVIDMAHAPGVSAMNPSGWSARQAEAAAEGAGRCPRVRCFDIMELCPPHDEGGRTARLAAHLFLSFLRGFAERSA